MKPVHMFTMASCPYCRAARRWMEEVFAAHPEYREIPLEITDEVEEPAYADQFDYYYVPTYYVDGKKVHEGAATKEIVESVFRTAYEG